MVIGAGLMGLASAWLLAERGHRITVLERRGGPAQETSFANGGLLTPSMSDPWNAPGVHRNLLRWLGRSDAPMLLRLRAIPSLLSWGAAFLRNSAPQHFARSMHANYALAVHSLDAMRSFAGEGWQPAGQGTMKLFRDPRAFEHALAVTETLARHGLHYRRLDAAGAVRVEPHLSAIENRIAGALLYPDDRYGDAHRFCRLLAERLRERGVDIVYDATVLHLIAEDGKVAGVRYRAAYGRHRDGREATIKASQLVVAAGSHSPGLVSALGIRLPVKPVKGYSLTIDAVPDLPGIAVVDDGLHAAVTPLDGCLRVAGTAEFCGFDLSVPQARVHNLRHLLASIYPHLHRRIAEGGAVAWTGLRPASPDGVPIIGATRIGGLYLNTGHGHLGWTLAMGSACLLADSMTPSGARAVDGGIDGSLYAQARFEVR